MKGFSIRKKNCKQFFSVNSNKKYLQAAIFSSPLTDMLFCCNRLCFHNKKTPDPGNKTGTRVYFPRCHPDCSEHPPNLLNSYKGLTLPTFIGSLESGTFSFLRRFAPTTGSLKAVCPTVFVIVFADLNLPHFFITDAAVCQDPVKNLSILR